MEWARRKCRPCSIANLPQHNPLFKAEQATAFGERPASPTPPVMPTLAAPRASTCSQIWSETLAVGGVEGWTR